jgi:AmmeMemoRadiSam system protein A
MLTSQERGILLLCARGAIANLFSGNPATVINLDHYPNLREPCGAFVTLTKNNELRGCIGYIVSDEPLFNTVCDVAKLAATQDPRFPRLQESELPEVLIEISVLTPPQLLKEYDDIIIGTHGLILEDGTARGVLLPQVAVEHNMNVPEFLSALCRKAGLPVNEWQKRKLRLTTFTAEVFGEQPHKALTGEKH